MSSRLQEMAKSLEAWTTGKGPGSIPTIVPGVYVGRFPTTQVPERRMFDALTCLIVQGLETLYVGAKPMACPAGSSVVIAQRFPLVRKVQPASDRLPYLCFTLVLDIPILTSMIHDLGMPTVSSGAEAGAASARAGVELVAAYERLLGMLSEPAEAKVLGPGLLKEIYYRLLTGPNGCYIRDLTVSSKRFLRVTDGMEWLRANLARQVPMEELSRHMGMSASAMHQGFRAVCGMTPLAFHKQLRLQKARTLLISDDYDVGTAAAAVGYSSASQFIREYRRLFQSTPGREVRQYGRAVGSSV